MAPIYESDVAEERFAQGEWNHYELWEKVEQRLRRHKRLWILATFLVFLMLSSVPIVMEQLPHWRTLGASRRLAQEVNWIKRQAGIEHSPYRIRFLEKGGSLSLNYVVERVADCASAAPGQAVVTRSLIPAREDEYQLLSHDRGERAGIPGLTDQFCYDPLGGSQLSKKGEDLSGFGIIPAKDLAEGRLDRMAVLLLSGPSADPAF